MQLPTAGGKTRIAGALLSEWLKNGRKAIWLTHRKELVAQTAGMLQEVGVRSTPNPQWMSNAAAPVLVGGTVILMAQTVSRRTAKANVWDRYRNSDLMIIDEAHHATAEGWARAMEQWPGPVMGMTATPWRLSQKEGFDHLFKELHCGPQVATLQSQSWLCRARVLSPPEEEQIQGGQVDKIGDYSEAGIGRANEDRDIWTAGVLQFWQQHGEDRQTIVYAVSVKHALNLIAVFGDAGIPAGVLLSDTPGTVRAKLIDQFQDGTVKVLINVAVATEGFDLPDVGCVVLTRPTMSLSLYLQMVGRGLRPKQGDGDCVILDLAGNSLRHGLPEEDRVWSLQPRGKERPPGEFPSVWCPHCEYLSSAGSHQCSNCGAPFGEPCGRCGAWRAWKRWSRKTSCGEHHEFVCDLCHYDAHIQARLPVTEELKELAKLADDDELSPIRDPFLKNFLEEELRRFGSKERKDELRSLIGIRESKLEDDNELNRLFESHLDTLPTAERPQSKPQEHRLFNEWEDTLKRELMEWREELAELEAQRLDKRLVYDNAKDRLLRLFEAEAREAGFLPQKHVPGKPPQSPVSERILSELAAELKKNKPSGTGSAESTILLPPPKPPSIAGSERTKRDALRGYIEGTPTPPQPRVSERIVEEVGAVLNKNEPSSSSSLDLSEWMTFVQLGAWGKEEPTKGTSTEPWRLKNPQEREISLSNWAKLLSETVECLIQEGSIANDTSVVTVGNAASGHFIYVIRNVKALDRESSEKRTGRYLIHVTPKHPDGREFMNRAQLSNGLYLERNWSSKGIAQLCRMLVEKFGQDPAQFHVRLR